MSMFSMVGQETDIFLRVDNFATASDRQACDMSQVSKFNIENNFKISCVMSVHVNNLS